MEKNTMFRMASNTKPPVATAIGILVEEGKLAYDDPVRKHIPSFDNYKAGFIQIKHLLSHTSGFRIPTLFLQPYMQPSAQHPDAPTLVLEAARFGEVGAEVMPGTSYSYNNPGFNTLGALVEMAGGQPLEEFLDDRIYTPLGMNDSYNHELPAAEVREVDVLDDPEEGLLRGQAPHQVDEDGVERVVFDGRTAVGWSLVPQHRREGRDE